MLGMSLLGTRCVVAFVLALCAVPRATFCPTSRTKPRTGRPSTSTTRRTTMWTPAIIPGRSSCSTRSRGASRMAATRNRRYSRAPTRTIAQGETATAIAACDRFIRTYPNHPNVDYAYYLKGRGQLPRGSGHLRLHRRAGPFGARPEDGAGIVRRIQGSGHPLSGQPVRAGRLRAHALSDQRAVELRSARRRLLLPPRRLPRGGEPGAGIAGHLSADTRRTRTR